MTDLSRRKLIVTGLAATAGVTGLGVAARLAEKYGLVPPDHGGIYGPGETLTYAAQRLLTRHSLAREFPRSQISKRPLANEIPPFRDDFKRLAAGGFVDWRLNVDGMVGRPASFSLTQLKSYPSLSRASLPRFGRCGDPPASQIRCVLLDRSRLVGKHGYGRRSASADVSRLRDEWR